MNIPDPTTLYRLPIAEVLDVAERVRHAMTANALLCIVNDFYPEAHEIDINWSSEYDDEGGCYKSISSVVLRGDKGRVILTWSGIEANGVEVPEQAAEMVGEYPLEVLDIPRVEAIESAFGTSCVSIDLLLDVARKGNAELYGVKPADEDE